MDRNDRINAYHFKLKKHVLDFWKTRNVEPRDSLDSNPRSRERLYLALDLNSMDDPDSRYLNDTLRHLKVKRYHDSLLQRESIKNSIEKHNKEVVNFSMSIARFFVRVESLGLKIENKTVLDPASTEAFNLVALFEHLDEYYQSPAKALLKTSNSVGTTSLMWLYMASTTWYTAAMSGERSKIESLYQLLVEFAPQYAETRKSLKTSIDSIQATFQLFRNMVIPIGYDVEDREFTGECAFEDRVKG